MIGHLALLMTLSGNLYGLCAGYRRPSRTTRIAARFAHLESMLLAGLVLVAIGLVTLGIVYAQWVERDYRQAPDILMPVLGTLALTLGMQNALGGFLLAIIGGNEARFFDRDDPR